MLHSKNIKHPDEVGGFRIDGFLKIFDPTSNEIFVNKHNAIHYENISVAMSESFSNQGKGFIHSMAFGTGGTAVDPTGLITYLTPNTIGINASLYNQTYEKSITQSVRHISGATYSDILVSCLLDFGEPQGQEAFDNSVDFDGQFVFDELGLKSFSPTGNGKLLTHVVFHPVQKSLNRLMQIDYTVRIQSLTGFTGDR